MNESTFEADFQTFLRGGLFQSCLREDLERERCQNERIASLADRCRHGNRSLSCSQCYFERDPKS